MSFIVVKVAIKSDRFGNFLRIDAEGMNTYSSTGSVSVTGSITQDHLSVLYPELYSDGTCSIRAPDAPGCYLRMKIDASPDFQDAGVGHANCQYWLEHMGVNPGLENLRLRSLGDGTGAIESVAFPGNFLRMDEDGNVNCQYHGEAIRIPEGAWERFQVLLMG
ncbi:uncharacterized protein PAC_17762 [Phialocephala subalpina]|uniref:Uncharacterized protein n=1 Tax=Phialocephala subalpina TaxID=576137 RepID=A0A1L7XS41_9HELO|nr:uncharacterized protein PAC_17762 [Phialocephala subalpina]